MKTVPKTSFTTGLFTLRRALVLVFKVDMLQSVLLAAMIVLSGVVPILGIRTSAKFIDYVTTSEIISMSTVAMYLVYWGTYLLVSDLAIPLTIFLQSNLGDKVTFAVNRDIIRKSNAIEGLIHFEQTEFHNDIQMLMSQASSRPINLVITLAGLLRELTIISSCIVLLFSKLSWLSILLFLSGIVHTILIGNLQKEAFKESFGQSTRSRMMKYISSLSIDPAYAKEIRLFPIGDYLYKEYNRLHQLVYNAMLVVRRKQLLWPILSSFLSLASHLAALFYLAYLINEGKMMAGAIVLFLQTVVRLHYSILSFGGQLGWAFGHLLFFEKYFDFLSQEEKVYKNSAVIPSVISKSADIHIVFDKVSFIYPDGRQALQNITFEILPGEKLAIVGANGAGKTSLVKLLCGLYPPTSGEIRINSQTIDQYDVQEVRKLIAPIFQDFGTYSLSLKQNVVMGAIPINEGRLKDSLMQAGGDFVDLFEKNSEQPLGKLFGGTELSGGQWQKLAIARAIYKDTSVLILDEPTASLDPISESKLYDQFMKLCQGKTTIFITHRLASVKTADRILLLDNGRCQAIDTHSQLLKLNSLYKEMYESQASKYKL